MISSKIECLRSRWLCGHFRKSLKTDFKGTIRWKRKKVLGCVYKPNSNNLKIWKRSYLNKNLGVGVGVDFPEAQFSNFAIKYLSKNEKVRETVFACSYGAQIESFKQKNWSKISWHCPFKQKFHLPNFWFRTGSNLFLNTNWTHSFV